MRSYVGLRALLPCWLVASLVVSSAEAQPWSGDPRRTATAQALFDQARAEMDSGDFATACPKLEEVVRLEPNGNGAKLKLAECYELDGRFASAFAMYTIAEAAAQAAGQTERVAWAHERGAAARARASTISIVVASEVGALAGFVVTRDDEPVGSAQWSTPIPVDGGRVVVVARAPGFAELRREVEVEAEGAALTVQIDHLDKAEEPVVVTPVKVEPPPPAAEPPPPAKKEPPVADVSNPMPSWVWITGAVGLASGIVGVALRADGAVVEADQADACGPKRDACPATYDVEGTNQRKLVDFGLFVGFGVSGAALLGAAVIGAVVHLTSASTSSAPRASLVVQPGGLMLTGSF
ncbi:MAG: hypothetical protein U0271_43750 [Polyangiaceae bacterium]